MQIHIEVAIEGQRERQRIATIHRSADLSAVDGLGLTLAESKDLLECLQATVVRVHPDRARSRQLQLRHVRTAAGPQGRMLDRLSHGLWQAQLAESAAVLAMPVRRTALWW